MSEPRLSSNWLKDTGSIILAIVLATSGAVAFIVRSIETAKSDVAKLQASQNVDHAQLEQMAELLRVEIANSQKQTAILDALLNPKKSTRQLAREALDRIKPIPGQGRVEAPNILPDMGLMKNGEQK